MHKVVVNGKGEKSLQRNHPWIFSGAVQDVNDHPAAMNLPAGHYLKGLICMVE